MKSKLYSIANSVWLSDWLIDFSPTYTSSLPLSFPLSLSPSSPQAGCEYYCSSPEGFKLPSSPPIPDTQSTCNNGSFDVNIGIPYTPTHTHTPTRTPTHTQTHTRTRTFLWCFLRNRWKFELKKCAVIFSRIYKFTLYHYGYLLQSYDYHYYNLRTYCKKIATIIVLMLYIW